MSVCKNENRITFLLLLTLFVFAGTSVSSAQVFYTGYTYDGRIALEYQRFENDRKSTDDFTHSYNLNVQGPILDPRLITFNAGGYYSQRVGDSYRNDVTRYGYRFRMSLLNERPWRGFLFWVPQPIRFRYQHGVNDNGGRSEYTGYGVSASYTLPLHIGYRYKGRLVSLASGRQINAYNKAVKRKYEAGNVNRNIVNKRNRDEEGEYVNNEYTDNEYMKENNLIGNEQQRTNESYENRTGQQRQVIEREKPPTVLSMRFPQFHFDYDVLKRKDDSGDEDTFRTLSVRGSASTLHQQYIAEYRKKDYEYADAPGIKSQAFWLYADYKYSPLADRRDSLRSYNRLSVSDGSDTTSTAVSDATSWSIPLGEKGRDRLNLLAGANYSETDSDTGDMSAHGFSAGMAYAKRLSPRATNQTGIRFGYRETDVDSFHSEYLSNLFNVRITRSLFADIEARIGNTEEGIPYSMGAGVVHIGRRVRTRFNYNYSFEPHSNDAETVSHRYNLRFSGRLLRRMTYVIDNEYKLSRMSSPSETTDHTTYTLDVSTHFSVGRFGFNIGDAYNTSTTSNSIDTSYWSNSLYGNTQVYLTRRMFFTLYALWAVNNSEDTTYQVSPFFSWYFRKVTLTARYRYRRIEGNNQEREDHRIVVRGVRYFDGILY